MIPKHATAKLEDLKITPPERVHVHSPQQVYDTWQWITIPVYYFWTLATEL